MAFMIRRAARDDLEECVRVIRSSFLTVAEEFGFTQENAPRFTAFAMDMERLLWHYEQEKRPMLVYDDNGQILGYYSLLRQNETECELNNLCVLPEHRHRGIGKELLEHAVMEARNMGCTVMNIGIVEENRKLRRWYEENGAVHTGTEKFDFFPFICGKMRKMLID